MQFTKEQLIKRLEEQESAARYALSFVQDSEILRDIEMDLRITEIALASLAADSNNHPAPVPLSNDRLYRIRAILGKAAAQSDGGNIGYAMSDAVRAFDELLEVRKAEPVAYIRSAHKPDGSCFADGIHPTHRHQRLPLSTLQDGCYWKVTPLYAAPPAQDAVKAIDELMEVRKAEPVAFINGAWTLVYYRPPKESGLKIGDKLYTAPPAPLAIDERAAFNAWNNEDNLPIAGVGAKNAAWLAWQARARLGSPTAPVVPATLPCAVELKPGLIIGKGCKTETLLTALQRRADYYAEIDAMTPEERAEHDANIEAFKAMLPQPVPDERKAFEEFMDKRFGDTIDQSRAKNGDQGYMAWDMVVAWIAWQGRAAMLNGGKS